MITLNIKKDGEHVDIRFPCTEKVLTNALKMIGVNDELDTKQTVSEVVDFESLSLLEGKEVNLDEMNYLAKRLDSMTKTELDKFCVVATMEGLDEPKDFINLTFNLRRYTLIQSVGDMTAVGRTHTLTRELAIPADDSRDTDYARIGRELIASNKGKWTEKGLLFFNDDSVAHFIDGKEYVGTTYNVNGRHLLTVADDWGNTCEYQLIVVRNAPIIGYVVGDGEGVTNTVTFDRTYYFKDQVTVRIGDEYDEMAMFRVYDENWNLLGSFSLDETCLLAESGSYTVVAVNHAGETEAFALIISRDAPKATITENETKKKLEIVVTPSVDSESHIQTLEIYKSTDGGETWVLLNQDDYGTQITTDTLSYAFRQTAQYKVVVTDEFRTGIDAIMVELSYVQKSPEGLLKGVENGGHTNKAVTFEWTDEAIVCLTKDGEVVEYESGQALTENGVYELTFENFDGYTATYTFTIDTVAPEITTEGANHREAVNQDVKVFYTEEHLTAELFKNGKSLGEYVSGNPISADGMYRVRVWDIAGNEVSVEFTIDKTVDYEINVYDKGLSNSVVATTHEIVTTELVKDGKKVDYAIGSAINQVGDYTLVLTDALGNKEVITFRIIQPKVQEFTHNFDDIEGFGGVLVNGEEKRLNYGTLELFSDGAYEVGVIVGGKTYTFNVTVDGTAPTLKLNGVENGGITKDGVKLTELSETAEVKVFKDGKEIEYKLGDEITEVGKYKVTATDECGNQTVYEFEVEKSVNGWLIAFIIIGVLVLASGVTVFILKRKEIL